MVFRLFAGVGEEEMAMQGEEMEPKKGSGASLEQAKHAGCRSNGTAAPQTIHSPTFRQSYRAQYGCPCRKVSGDATRIPGRRIG